MSKFYVLRESKSGLYVSQFYCSQVWSWTANKEAALIIRGEDNADATRLEVERAESRWPADMFGGHNPPQMEYVSA